MNVWKLVGMIAGGFFLLGALAYGFVFFNSSKEQAGYLNTKMTRLNESLTSVDVDMYDGNVVSGSEVLNAINKFKSDDIAIQVKTKAGNEPSYYNYSIGESNGSKVLKTTGTATIQSARTKGRSNYINPLGRFTGSIIRDANDSVIGVKFEQN